MIRISTAHHRTGDWVEIQRRYLDHFIDEPFLLYGSLEEVPTEHHESFDVVVESLGNHAGKLNLLGRAMLADADPDDLLVFLDGDAFPVGDVMARVREGLGDADLVAVQRLENHGDHQPHPCFCAVPARTWGALPGDWTSGYPLRPGRTDVGANLLWLLTQRNLSWSPMRRTNKHNPHPLLFGVYDDVVYHHGAGFRGMKPPGEGEREWPQKQAQTTMAKHAMHKLEERMPADRFEARIARMMEDAVLSEEVYGNILADFDFYRRFI